MGTVRSRIHFEDRGVWPLDVLALLGEGKEAGGAHTFDPEYNESKPKRHQWLHNPTLHCKAISNCVAVPLPVLPQVL